MKPLLTLTTDFGTQDGYVGAMKGKILSIQPQAQIIDITHDISPQSILHGAHCLARSTLEFPPHTIHLVVIDPGVGSSRKAVLVQTETFHFVAPDNGVLSLVLEKFQPTQILSIFPETPYWKAHSSFDGLHLFAPVAAHLSAGLAVEKIGKPIFHLQSIHPARSVVKSDRIIGEILSFDRFGNALTNITQTQIHTLKEAMQIVQCNRNQVSIYSHYAEGGVTRGSLFGIFNSDQHLELSVYCGSAKEQFSLAEGDTVTYY